jgi:hypothetical protein
MRKAPKKIYAPLREGKLITLKKNRRAARTEVAGDFLHCKQRFWRQL